MFLHFFSFTGILLTCKICKFMATTWWLDARICCEMITMIKLLSAPFPRILSFSILSKVMTWNFLVTCPSHYYQSTIFLFQTYPNCFMVTYLFLSVRSNVKKMWCIFEKISKAMSETKQNKLSFCKTHTRIKPLFKSYFLSTYLLRRMISILERIE